MEAGAFQLKAFGTVSPPVALFQESQAGGCRKDCTTLAGQTKRSVEDVMKKKARISTDCTIVRVGRRSETISH